MRFQQASQSVGSIQLYPLLAQLSRKSCPSVLNATALGATLEYYFLETISSILCVTLCIVLTALFMEYCERRDKALLVAPASHFVVPFSLLGDSN